jgi:hypothetical protein
MMTPIGLFRTASEAIRQGAEMTALDLAGLIIAACLLTGAVVMCPKG